MREVNPHYLEALITPLWFSLPKLKNPTILRLEIHLLPSVIRFALSYFTGSVLLAYQNVLIIYLCLHFCYFSLFLLLFSVKLFNVVTNLISTFLHPPLVSLIHKGAGHKNYIKLIVDIIIRAKTTECLEENIGVNLCYFVLGDCLSDMSPKAQMTKTT